MKLMVVGAANKGKTTLLNQLLQRSGAGQTKKSNLATLGVSIKPWNYQQKQHSGSSATYKITCWDFAGQEEFYTTHQCFLSQQSVYIVSEWWYSCFKKKKIYVYLLRFITFKYTNTLMGLLPGSIVC